MRLAPETTPVLLRKRPCCRRFLPVVPRPRARNELARRDEGKYRQYATEEQHRPGTLMSSAYLVMAGRGAAHASQRRGTVRHGCPGLLPG